ncbi:hypothetical protein RQP46_008752 [Phenoliferia psychrophenolica]
MAPASLLGLPTELKAHIVSLVSQQDDHFRARIAERRELELPLLIHYEQPKGTAGGSLAALSLVNKELRALAAPFKELKASQTGDRVVQYAILRKYPSAFSSLHFDSTRDARLLESTLASSHTFKGVTSLTLSVESAQRLVCVKRHGTLHPQAVDPLALSALRNLSNQVVRLEINGHGLLLEEPLTAIIECFPKLTHLALLGESFADAGTMLAHKVDSLEYLEDLSIELGGGYVIRPNWSQYPWTRPLRRLYLQSVFIIPDEWEFIKVFSGSLEKLTLRTDALQDPPGGPVLFPRLHTLTILVMDPAQANVLPIVQHFTSSPLSTLVLEELDVDPFDADNPLVTLIATSLPTLRHLDVGHLTEADDLFLQGFGAAKGIEIVRRHQPTLFRNPSAAPANAQPTALEALKRVLEFGRTSVERAERENDETAFESLVLVAKTTRMAYASLLGLPTELKAYIVSLVAQQDDRFRARTSTRSELELPTLPGSEGRPYEHPTGKVGKSLSELSCVNKELRAFAAPHLFKELKASRMGDRILQYSILQSYPTAFSTLNFDSTRDARLLESTLAVAHTLTNITSVTIATDAAFALFCAKGVDQLALGALRKISKNVVSLRLSGPENAEDRFLALLVECFSNLKRLEIYLSDSPLVKLHYNNILLEHINLEDPLLQLISTSLPTLRFLDVDPLFGDDERSLQHFCDSKFIKLGHRHSTSLFHDPSLAQVDEPAPTLEALKRVLDFGRASVERAEREGDTTAMERLLAILGSLEDERLRWTD